MTTPVRRPLEAILALDLGQIYNGPTCGLLLSFLGARVIKIEAPEGDILRRRKRDVEPCPLVALNSNKESVVLDLKHPEGKVLFLRLVRKVDVEGLMRSLFAQAVRLVPLCSELAAARDLLLDLRDGVEGGQTPRRIPGRARFRKS